MTFLMSKPNTFKNRLVAGWPWLGIGYVRCYLDDNRYYTLWMLFLTKYFSIGVHVSNPWRRKTEDKQNASQD